MESKEFKIGQEDLQKLVNYLVQKPFMEVNQLIDMLTKLDLVEGIEDGES